MKRSFTRSVSKHSEIPGLVLRGTASTASKLVDKDFLRSSGLEIATDEATMHTLRSLVMFQSIRYVNKLVRTMISANLLNRT